MGCSGDCFRGKATGSSWGSRLSAPVLSSAPTLRTHSRALHALPVTALVVDLVVITVTVFLAAYGRNHLLALRRGTASRVGPPHRSAARHRAGSWSSPCAAATTAASSAPAPTSTRPSSASSLFTAGVPRHRLLPHQVRALPRFLPLRVPDRAAAAGRRAASCSAAGCTTPAGWAPSASAPSCVGSSDHVDAVADVFDARVVARLPRGRCAHPAARAGRETQGGVPVLGNVDRRRRPDPRLRRRRRLRRRWRLRRPAARCATWSGTSSPTTSR